MSTNRLNSNGYDDQNQQNQDLLGGAGAGSNTGTALIAGAAAAAAAGAVGSGGIATGGDGAFTTDTVTTAGSGLVFNNTFGTGASSISSQITTAEQDLQALATNAATINATFSAVNQGNNGDLADNSFFTVHVSFSQLKAALAAHENTTVGADAVASLTTDVSNGAGYNLPEAYAAMLGLYSGSIGQDTITLNTYYLTVDSQNNQSIINALTHELSEGGMGRIGGLGDQNSFWSTMDLFRFNASGGRDVTDGRDNVTTYFSYNDGLTTSQSAGLSFNNEYSGSTKVNGGDTADWNDLDVFGYGDAGETFGLSQTDYQVMEALGWNPTFTPTGLPITYANDFNGLGFGDILFAQGNELGVWTENSSLNPTWSVLSPNTNGWSVVGTGDYNGDGRNDILWQAGQELGVWTENANLNPTWTLLSPNLNGWSVVGGGDYSGGAESDILFQNGQELGVWTMNNSLNPTWSLISPNLNGWSVVGSGDYNGGTYSDILFQNGQDLGVWLENGNLQNPTWQQLSPNLNGWSVVGSGDYNGDGFSDILFQNGSELGVWLENGNLNPTWDLLSPNLNGWSVVGSADYNGATNNGNKISDILFQNGQNLGVWTFSGGSLNPTWHLLSGNLNGWNITGAGSPGIR